jgi:hypothetical protein
LAIITYESADAWRREAMMTKPKLPTVIPENDMIDTVAYWFDLAYPHVGHDDLRNG